MIRLILAGLCLLLLLVSDLLPAAGQYGEILPVTGELSRNDTQPLMDFVCVELGIEECMSAPPVLTVLISGRYTKGFHYRGSGVVYIKHELWHTSSQEQFVKWSGILAHEFVHYALSEKDILQGESNSCDNEAKSWYVYNLYVLDAGYPNLAVTNWASMYPGCEDWLTSETSSEAAGDALESDDESYWEESEDTPEYTRGRSQPI